MDKTTRCNIISRNLWNLYKTIGNQLDLPVFNQDQVNCVRSNPSPWPDFIFNTSFISGEENSKLYYIDQLIIHEKLSPFWITDPNHSLLKYEKLLNEHGYKLVMKWPGMILETNKTIFESKKGFTTKRLHNIDQIKSWFHIVEKNLFQGKKFDQKYFTLFKNSNLKFIVIQINRIPVGTTLVHISGDTAGFYMVSVNQEYRKMGIATWFMNNMIHQLYLQGIKHIVLQANELSTRLYQELGFTNIGDFEIYWKIGLI